MPSSRVRRGVWGQHYRTPSTASSPRLRPDGAEGGGQRQGNLVLSSEKVAQPGGLPYTWGPFQAPPSPGLGPTRATVPHVAR